MTRVLLVIDRHGWCFDNIAQQVKKYCSDEFEIDIATIDDAMGGLYDVVVAFWYGYLPILAYRLKKGVGVLCIYDDYSWHQPGGAQQLEAAMRYCDVLGCANEKILAQFATREQRGFLIEDGVDTDLFTPLPYPERFTVGWVGNSAASGLVVGDPTYDLKGLETIREACRKVGAQLLVHDVSVDAPIPHDKMPEWYAKISCYVCASSAEGTPNPPLEALACGRPVVTTPVGIMPKVVQPGVNGKISKTADEFAASLRLIDWAKTIPEKIAATVEPWSWKHKVEAWREMLREAAKL